MINPDSDLMSKKTYSDFRVVYICSAARSGSTLTDMFMGGHSQVASLGEINLINKAISLDANCSCGEKLRTCIHWKKIYDFIFNAQGINLINDPYKLRLWDALAFREVDHQRQTFAFRFAINLRKAWMKFRDSFPSNIRNSFPIPPILLSALYNKMNLYQSISRCWGKSIIVDSSKNVWEAVELHQRWPNIVKIVLLTRDGRGVYLSRRTSGRDQSESVNGWLKYYRRALPLLENYVSPESLLKIRYEDLASEPDKTARILCEFCNIPYEKQMVDLSSVTRHLVNGNDTRFFPGRGIKLDERWRTELKDAELDFFERIGGEMNQRLGYR
ncbi:MAG: sulfotransferase [Nitrosomonas sp. PRO4]|nr:sulfotransferase [Nitrosomonas sp. PRO4]